MWSPPQRSCFSAQRSRQSSLQLNCSPRNKRPLGRGRVGAGSRISLTALRQRPLPPLPTPSPSVSAPASPPPAGFQVSIRYSSNWSRFCDPRPFLPCAHRGLPCEIFAGRKKKAQMWTFSISIPQRSFAFSEKPYLKHHPSPWLLCLALEATSKFVLPFLSLLLFSGSLAILKSVL